MRTLSYELHLCPETFVPLSDQAPIMKLIRPAEAYGDIITRLTARVCLRLN